MSPGPSGAAAPLADATALAEAVRHGNISAEALMRASIERAKSDAYGSICHLDVQMGERAAAQSDRERNKPASSAGNAAFTGLPFLAKDLGNGVRGLPVHAGSAALASRIGPANRDSLIFERFRQAGLLPFGVTTVPEFGLALTCEPPGGAGCAQPVEPGILSRRILRRCGRRRCFRYRCNRPCHGCCRVCPRSRCLLRARRPQDIAWPDFKRTAIRQPTDGHHE